MHREQEALSVQVRVDALEDPCDTRGFPIEARHHSGEALCRSSLRAFFKTPHSFFLSQVLGFEVKYETELRCDDIPLALGPVSSQVGVRLFSCETGSMNISMKFSRHRLSRWKLRDRQSANACTLHGQLED